MLLQWDTLKTAKGGSLRTPYIQDDYGNTHVHPVARVDGDIYAKRGRINIKDSISGEWIITLHDGSYCKFFILGRKIIFLKENVVNEEQSDMWVPLRLTTDKYHDKMRNAPGDSINVGRILYIYENYIADTQSWLQFLNMNTELSPALVERLETFLVRRMADIDAMVTIKDIQSLIRKMSAIKARMFHNGTNENEAMVSCNMYRKLLERLFLEVDEKWQSIPEHERFSNQQKRWNGPSYHYY